MTKKLKEYTVCIQYDVQKIYIVSAKNEEQAQDLVLNGKGYSEVGDESWENDEVIEVNGADQRGDGLCASRIERLVQQILEDVWAD